MFSAQNRYRNPDGDEMSYHFGKVLAVAAWSGLLAACAGTQKSASSSSTAGRPQQALAQQSQTDAMLRAGLPMAQADGSTDQACALIPPAQQNVCPVQQTAVLGARQLRAPLDPKGYAWTPAGAVVYIVAAPGLTEEWLGHLVECYQARTAATGNALQERESCPLAEPDVSYSIASTRNGFAVSIRSEHSEAAKRIFDVSQRLAPSSAPQRSALAVRP
jgi:RNA polymerase subunit RPABC4/transcription elongation factor Spt4